MYKNKKKETMEALIFEMRWSKLLKAYIRGKRNISGYWKNGGPVAIKQVHLPSIITEKWVLVKTEYCGICGSDMKEITLNGAHDNPLRSLISFPQILGHEPVGIIEKIGKKVTKVKNGDRVALNPWFPCKTRGINIECARCQIGDYIHCHNFQKGVLPIGMHLGITKGFGGFAPLISVHESQCFLIPDNVSLEKAVLADPFSVAFHSLLILDPSESSTVLVYGLGIIGLLVIMILNKILNIKKILAIGRYQFQKEMALKLGAKHVFMSTGEKLMEEIIDYLNLEFYKPEKGLKWTLDGVDGIIDTIASAETLEIGIRILTTQSKLVFLGVSTPKRFEHTLHYFKELEIIGSNAFSLENFKGKRAHAFEFYLEFLAANRIDPSELITHKFTLKEYKTAFDTLADKSKSHAIKVLFSFGDTN
ncbi:MAG: zinc-binding dehydrogenase [Candidatus Thorarchaeota archaeon]